MNIIKTIIIGSCVIALTRIHIAAVTVPGSANPWLAGMPDGTPASSGDVAPGESPVLAPISLVPGSSLSWSASGTVSHGGETSGPDGGTPFSHSAGAEHGKSDIVAPINALLGVFLAASSRTVPHLPPSTFRLRSLAITRRFRPCWSRSFSWATD